MIRTLLFALLTLPGRLPFRWRRFCGRLLGDVGRFVATRRRKIAARNLQMALPELTAAKREKLVREHFHKLGESFMDELWMTTVPARRLQELAVVENAGALSSQTPPRGAILLMPHFAGMNIAGAVLHLEAGGVMALYRPMHIAFWEAFFLRLRGWHGTKMTSAKDKDALRRCINHLRGGGKLIYLPDIDAKRGKSSVFAPFLAVQNAATYGNIGRIAKAGAADILPCLVTMTGQKYYVNIGGAMRCGESLQQNAAALNAVVGGHIRACPAAYYWLHRRFKTRPPGEANPYQ
ncbi:MAG: lysophospholipid acyltransferase family protein [Gammaproteobacteria bacterium]